MTKNKADHKGDHKGKNKNKGHGGHQHHVVQSHPKNPAHAKKHNRDHDPFYIGTGEVKQHMSLSDNLTKKDKHAVEKLEAEIEYAEAHDQTQQAEKLKERINMICDKAEEKAKHTADHGAEVKVIHSGGHWKHHHHSEEQRAGGAES